MKLPKTIVLASVLVLAFVAYAQNKRPILDRVIELTEAQFKEQVNLLEQQKLFYSPEQIAAALRKSTASFTHADVKFLDGDDLYATHDVNSTWLGKVLFLLENNSTEPMAQLEKYYVAVQLQVGMPGVGNDLQSERFTLTIMGNGTDAVSNLQQVCTRIIESERLLLRQKNGNVFHTDRTLSLVKALLRGR